MILGVHMTLLIGPTIAVPAPLAITESLASVEVTQTDSGRSGFQLTFHVGRSGPWDLADHRLLLHPLLRPFSRVVVMVRFNLTPIVLIDGFITQFQLTPSQQPGASTLVVTGEDVSVMMTLEQTAFQYPMPETEQVRTILAKYAVLGWTNMVIDQPPVPDPALPTREIATQNDTDYTYLEALACRHSFVFYVRPGRLPNTNVAYWGRAVPATALAESETIPGLSVNMGPQTNVDSISFTYDALAAEMVLGEAVEPTSNIPVPVIMPPFSTDLPLSLLPAAVYQLLRTRITRPGPAPATPQAGNRSGRSCEAERSAHGATVPQAFERARARVNEAARNAVTAEGELDGLRYGGVLQARSIVGLRGAGATNDGKYFVERVSHRISQGSYRQSFTLRREGVGSIVPLVRS